MVVIQNFISMNHESLPLQRPWQGSNMDHHTLHMFYHSHTPHWQMIQPYGSRRLAAQGANRIWICLQIGCIFIQNLVKMSKFIIIILNYLRWLGRICISSTLYWGWLRAAKISLAPCNRITSYFRTGSFSLK